MHNRRKPRKFINMYKLSNTLEQPIGEEKIKRKIYIYIYI